MSADHGRLIRRTFELAWSARQSGNHPFGALLAAADGTILLEAENSVGTTGDCTGHAETNLMRSASQQFPRKTLAAATLYSSAEPCAMCAGAIYWGGVGQVVYGLSERELLTLTGANAENPTLDLPCREVFARGQRPLSVIGPFLEEEARAVHAGFWD